MLRFISNSIGTNRLFCRTIPWLAATTKEWPHIYMKVSHTDYNEEDYTLTLSSSCRTRFHARKQYFHRRIHTRWVVIVWVKPVPNIDCHSQRWRYQPKYVRSLPLQHIQPSDIDFQHGSILRKSGRTLGWPTLRI